MKTFYFYFNDEANYNNEIIIIKASDEKQAKQKLINIYFKGLSKWSYNDIVDTLESNDFSIKMVNEIKCSEQDQILIM